MFIYWSIFFGVNEKTSVGDDDYTHQQDIQNSLMPEAIYVLMMHFQQPKKYNIKINLIL